MAAKKTRKTPVKPAAADSASNLVVGPGTLPLKSFFDGGGEFEDFSFGRFYWEVGEGERESIVPRIDKKLNPIRSATGEILASAAKVDLLLQPDAPQEYMDICHLIRRYEETLPSHELNAYAQVTIRFPNATNLHQPWEMVRAWATEHYASRVPVILILHAPHLSGSANPGHLHCIALCRSMSALGWSQMERGIACDAGQREAYESWTAFQEKWTAARSLKN